MRQSFPWLDRPPDAAIQSADRLLTRLGAIDDAARLTPIGQRLASIPVHPRIGRMLLAATSAVRRTVTLAAAMIAERDPYRGVGRRPPADLTARLEDWHDGAASRLDRSAVRTIQKAADQWQRIIADLPAAPGRSDLADCLIAGFPDRLCRRREPNQPAGLMVGGRGVEIPDQSPLATAELLIALDVDDRDVNATIRLGMAIDVQSLPDDRITRGVDHHFDDGANAVRARRVTRWIDLVIDQTPIACRPGIDAGAVLYEAVVDQPDRWLPTDGAAASLLARLQFLQRVWPEGDWPSVDPSQLREWLREFCDRCVDVEQIRRADWAGRITAAWDYPTRQRIDVAAPSTLSLPRGRRPTVDYPAEGPPRVTTRIQDVFGVQQTPRLAGGRVAVQFHLTSPAGRVAQITDDLAGFWSGSYALVRKDLRGRYPKHDWPDNPGS